ncbi:hypothetical protein [Mycolicibacterium iranicum]|uniref:MalT-like TPR region domain-containing protein n=1 Tax=Mycolicibacterium iranicum TaxID=912594 RepID=A0ABT4HI39_MYCIR|nr:hypothetical protein [Mycolicibacterium iranicum]MCZ0729618.1 hypothetical protein [Mycolicibacterium iranicum]
MNIVRQVWLDLRTRQLLRRIDTRAGACVALENLLQRHIACCSDRVVAAAAAHCCSTRPHRQLATAHAVVEVYDYTGRTQLLALAASRLRTALPGLTAEPALAGQAHMLLGNVYRESATALGMPDHFEEALRHTEQATALLPYDPLSWSSHAMTLRAHYDVQPTENVMSSAVAAARTAATLVDPADRAAAHYWCDLAALQLSHCAGDADAGSLADGAAAARRAVQLAHPGDPERGIYLSNLCLALRELGQLRRDDTLITEAIPHGLAATAAADSSANQWIIVAGAYLARYELRGNPADLDDAIRFGLQAVRTDPEHAPAATFTSSALHRRFEHNTDSADIDHAVALARIATTLQPSPEAFDALAIALASRRNPGDAGASVAAAKRAVPDPSTADLAHVITLANTLALAHDVHGIDAALDEAITLLQVHADTPGRLQSVVLSNLAADLITRFDHRHHLDDLDAAINALHTAITNTASDTAQRAVIQANLANAYLARSETTGRAADLDVAVDAAIDASEHLPPNSGDRLTALATLALALRTRYDLFNHLPDLHTAIAAADLALARAHPDPPRCAHLLDLLAGAHRALFERTASTADLTWACQAADIALAETPADHTSRPTRHTTLATCLLTRYEITGHSASLDEAVRHGRLALQTANHAQVAVAATNLGNALLTRYELRHAATDIADAVHAAQRGVDTTPALSPFQRARQSNLGNALRAYANAHGDRDALRAAVIAGRRSVAIDHSVVPAIAAYWSNLALSYSDRFDLDADPDDLDAAIQAATRAQSLSPPQHPSTALYNTNLAMLLRARYQARRVRDDIDTAIALLTTAAESTAETHPHYGALHLALGNAHHSRYESIGRRADYAAAQRHWSQACSSTTPPSTRLIAAESAAVAAHNIGDTTAATRAYTQAVACVPIIAWHGLDRPGREQALRDIGSLTGASCAAAIDAQQPTTALTNLETGRTVLWRQLTDLRADYRSLEKLDPDTAQRLEELGRLLDRPHTRD